jgi:hypothetical protein
MTVIDPRAVPIRTLVQSFLTVMHQNGVKTLVLFEQGTQRTTAMNHADAETSARSHFAIKDGAIEAVAIALHTFRFTDGSKLDSVMDACSLHPCALLEGGKPVPWDELPEEAKGAHRVLAGALVAAAIAFNPPKQSPILQG